MVHYRLTIHGKVQGVGFRFFTKQQASVYDIKGWVRNEANGTVEVDAEGETSSMNQFIDALKKGPGFSNVTKIDINEQPEIIEHKKFKVKY